MNRILPLVAALSIASIGVVAAQTNSQTTAPSSSTTPPAVSTSNTDAKTSAAPLSGSNSFTEAEAKKRLEAHGYSDVTDLKKDDKSVWRGKANKDGKPVGVALDYQGNIVAQ